MQQGSPSLQVPRWIQLVSLPIVLLAGWLFANAVRHALFVFLISGLVALLLNPLVNVLRRARVPRGLAVLLVLVFVATAVVTSIGIAGAAAVSQAQSVSDAATKQFEVPPGRQQSPAEKRIDAVQRWLDRNGLGDVRVRDSGNQLVEKIRTHGVSDYAQRALDIGGQIATTVAQGLIELVLILVISIYLLLDGPRISEGLDRWFPPGDDGLHLGRQVQQGLINYVRGQLIVSVLIGTSSGVIVYVLSLTGVWPGGKDYALILGLWALLTEVIPYVGPILGAIPAVALALLDSPFTALWVGLAYLAIHQLEGHVIVPRVMGQALGAHPLLVIFALLSGAELYGIAGALLALPVFAMLREIAMFFARRIELEPWPTHALAGGGLDLTVPVSIEPRPPPDPVTEEPPTPLAAPAEPPE